MKKTGIYLILICSFFDLSAQTNLDSLWSIWSDESLNDTIRLSALNEYTDKGVYYPKYPDTVFSLARLMLEYATIKGNRTYQAKSYRLIGRAHSAKNNEVDAMRNFIQALKIYQNIGDKDGIARSLWYMGLTHYKLGQYVAAVEQYTKSLDVLRELNDTNYISGILNNIGLIYEAQEDYEKALEYFEQSTRILEEAGSLNNVAVRNMINIYISQGNPQKALMYLNERIKQIESGITGEYYDSTSSALGILNGYGDIYAAQGEYTQAMEYYMRCLELEKKDSLNSSIAYYERKIGLLYLSMKKGELAVEWCSRALKGHIVTESIRAKREDCGCLYKSYKLLGNNARALEYHELFHLFNDSLKLDETAKSLQKMEFSRQMIADSLQQAEDKLKIDMAHQVELRKKDRAKNILIISALIILLIAAGLWNRVRYTRKANARLKIEKDRAERSEQFEQQFMANMSHEIRTPMNAVMGMTNLLLGKDPREDQLNYLNGIKKSSDNLLHIINDILDLSKVESGNIELEKIDFSVTDLIGHVKKMLQHRADEKGLELITNIKPDVRDVVMGDPVRLNQVLINLTGNAIKFTDKGSVVIEVNKESHGIQFAITDTGIGIPKDKLDTVFERFSQANISDTRKYGGTGLGLSISRQLIGIMGGNIAIESEVGYGTTFSFVVNLDEGSPEKLKQRLALEKSVDGSILDGLKILIADDNEYNRIVARDTLKSNANVEIHEAVDGQEAIDMLGKMQFDVILMDVQMPVMNGFDATRYIRSNFESPAKNTPIIALTASVLRTDLDKCKQAGMNSYIAKPFKAQQLITGIAQVLGITLRVKKSETQEGTSSQKQQSTNKSITNMSYLDEFCEGNKEKMKKYIALFTATAPGLIDNIRNSLEKNDMEAIANHVHSFKTKWIMMGMKETKDLAMKLERLCREDPENDQIKVKSGMLIENIELAIRELS